MRRALAAAAAMVLPPAVLLGSVPEAAGACPYVCPEPPGLSAVGLEAKAPHRAKIFVKVSTFGAERARGSLELTFLRRSGGTTGEPVVFHRAYPKQSDGARNVFNFRPLGKGRHDVIVHLHAERRRSARQQ